MLLAARNDPSPLLDKRPMERRILGAHGNVTECAKQPQADRDVPLGVVAYLVER